VAADFFAGLDYWRRLSGHENAPAAMVYAGDSQFRRHGVVARPWFRL
jgi:hypothetical protein